MKQWYRIMVDDGPWYAARYPADRILCRWFGQHSVSCRGNPRCTMPKGRSK